MGRCWCCAAGSSTSSCAAIRPVPPRSCSGWPACSPTVSTPRPKAVGDPELHTFLADIPFFAALDEATRLELAGQLEPVAVAAGQVIFRQGDAGDGLYLVVSGRLRVSVTADGPEHMLYDVGRGAIVGDMALLTDRPRAATVSAARDSDLLLLRVPSFTSLLERSPALVAGMIRLLVDRLVAVDRLLVEGRPRVPAPGGRTVAVACAGRSARAA